MPPPHKLQGQGITLVAVCQTVGVVVRVCVCVPMRGFVAAGKVLVLLSPCLHACDLHLVHCPGCARQPCPLLAQLIALSLLVLLELHCKHTWVMAAHSCTW